MAQASQVRILSRPEDGSSARCAGSGLELYPFPFSRLSAPGGTEVLRKGQRTVSWHGNTQLCEGRSRWLQLPVGWQNSWILCGCRFRSYDLWVMSPTRFLCAKPHHLPPPRALRTSRAEIDLSLAPPLPFPPTRPSPVALRLEKPRGPATGPFRLPCPPPSQGGFPASLSIGGVGARAQRISGKKGRTLLLFPRDRSRHTHHPRSV